MSNNPFHQCTHCMGSVCIAYGHEMLPTLCTPVPATVSDSFPLLRCPDVIVWENFGRLCLSHLLFQQLWMYRAQTIARTCPKLSIRRILQCLPEQNGHTEQWDVRCLRWFARLVCVFVSVLCLSRMMCTWFEWDMCQFMFHFLKLGKAYMHGIGTGSAPVSTRILCIA